MNNTNPRAIHETVLKDIIDIWDSIQTLRNDSYDSSKLNHSKTKHPMSSSSIAKASSNLNLVFPVICSRGISIENASMVSKAVEKCFRDFLLVGRLLMRKMVFSQLKITFVSSIQIFHPKQWVSMIYLIWLEELMVLMKMY